MSRITLRGTGHRYEAGGGYALEPFDFEFAESNSYALLGPSGCGKTTMLNIISGLIRPSEGRVLIDERDFTDVPTAGRNIAQVFQFPVIYPSKTVFENLAFPLECRGWGRSRIGSRVEEIAAVLGLERSLGKRAVGLTADAKQLISLGRGLVRDDVVALMLDEPLTVIDPQLKTHLRRKLKDVIARSSLTVIYVTHDQNEAMSFANQVVVMSAGRIVQHGTPEDLFERPGTTYVGYFIGSPAMNLLEATREAESVRVAGVPIVVPSQWLAGVPEGRFQVGIRPEYLAFAEPSNPLAIPARIVGQEDHGSVRVLEIVIGNARAKMKVDREVPVPQETAAVFLPAEKLRVFVNERLVV